MGGRLTREAICDLVRRMPDRDLLDAEVVVLPFVRQADGTYIMAVPVGLCWPEVIARVYGFRPRTEGKAEGKDA